ncbi:hypothetical protein [Altererythrobacter sp. ZODW24]|uniref:hypothetical protein n=1 Tax=Altererythrobacter sp. ZODW24 TaxID=2185142 RepID=UPI0013B35E52|nr:hypothetical protein [Altererythrobacter sp. ZODW24]
MIRLFTPALILIASPCFPLHAQETTTLADPEAGTGLCEADWQTYFNDPSLMCVSTDDGASIARSHEVQLLASAMDYAHASFSRYFAPPDERVAIVATPTFTAEQRTFLERFGYLPLSWIDDTSRAEMRRSSVRRQVEAQISALPQAKRDAIMAQALAQLPEPNSSLEAPDAKELGAASHEAGHLLLKAFFGDQPELESQFRRYGSVGPDWLDEIAAVLAENDELTSARYASASRSLAEGKSVPAYQLADYLEMEHPSLGAAQKMMARRKLNGTGTTQRTIMLSGDDAKKFLAESGGDPVQFYIQSRLFADYMIAKTGNEAIFLPITTHIRDGGTFGEWLEAEGRQHGLPSTVSLLQADWQDWAEKRLTAAN